MATNYQAAEAELSTLRDFLRWTTSRFEEARLFLVMAITTHLMKPRN